MSSLIPAPNSLQNEIPLDDLAVEHIAYFKKAKKSIGVQELQAQAGTTVRLDALIVGEYPGDGLPMPVAFPATDTVAEPNAGQR